jgi:protoheme IX farnesyltransferase
MIRHYLQLVKPGIIFGNLVTATGAFVLASSHLDLPILFVTLFSLALIIGSACIFNNIRDQKADALMIRTQTRALPLGLIAPADATVYATTLGSVGFLLITTFVGAVPGLLSLLGFAIYVVLYSQAKYLTPHATLLGSLAGALPPAIGYTAAHPFDLPALLLFLLVAFWQMPHFYSIALYRLSDYRAASIPVHPLVRGLTSTKKEILLYLLLYTLLVPILTLFGYTSFLFLVATSVVNLSWLAFSFRPFATRPHLWAKGMFRFSLLSITVFSVFLPI